MSQTPKERLFREPDGTRTGLLWLGFAVAFYAIHLYYSVLNETGSVIGLVLGTVFVITAIPEVLPSDRQRLAGFLRIASIVVAVGALVFLIT
ncbi:hypothetical protein ACLI4R_12365 [Natrialbaceae archaeon A-chndr2]